MRGEKEIEKEKQPSNVESQKKPETPQFTSLCASKALKSPNRLLFEHF